MEGATITKTIINTEATALKKAVEPIMAVSNALEVEGESNLVRESKKAATIAAIKKNQEVLELKAKIKKEADVKKTEAIKKTEELRNSKQGLLENLIDEQKKLILKMETKKNSLKPDEKNSMMTLLKSLTASIDKTKEDIKLLISQQTSQNVRKSFLDVQKELLDAELELFNAQQDSAENVDEIQRRVNRLRVEAAQKGFLPTSRPVRGRGSPLSRGVGFRGGFGRGMTFSPRGSRGQRGGGRGGRRGVGYTYPGQTSLDRRPTSLLVADVSSDMKDATLAHLAKFGQILESKEDEEGKSIIVQYKTRREAEAAMTQGRHFRDQLLTLSWYSSVLSESSELEGEEAEESSRLEEQEDLLDDYTPLDPTYLPPGLEDEGDKVTLRRSFLQIPDRLGKKCSFCIKQCATC